MTRPFLDQAYRHIGLSIEHIARLTGHTPDQVRRALHGAGIRTTTDPALSPWAARRHPTRTRPTPRTTSPVPPRERGPVS